jgi:hypothetical protein
MRADWCEGLRLHAVNFRKVPHWQVRRKNASLSEATRMLESGHRNHGFRGIASMPKFKNEYAA